MKQPYWLSRQDALWTVLLCITWAYVSLSSLLRQEWLAGFLEALTGVVLVGTSLRNAYAYWRARWTTQELERLMSLIEMEREARTPAGRAQIREHWMN